MKDQNHPSSFILVLLNYLTLPLFHLFSPRFKLFAFRSKLPTIQLFNYSTFLLFFFFTFQLSFAQNISINEDGTAPDPSAMLDVSDTTKGFLPPRMSTANMNAISSPAKGLMIFNTDSSKYAFYDGSNWKFVSGSSSNQAVSVTGGGDYIEYTVTTPVSEIDIDVSNVSGNDLMITLSGLRTVVPLGTATYMTFNNNTASIYNSELSGITTGADGVNLAQARLGSFNAAVSGGTITSSQTIFIYDFKNNTYFKSYTGLNAFNTSSDIEDAYFGGMWKSTDAISSIQFKTETHNAWEVGTVVRVYTLGGSSSTSTSVSSSGESGVTLIKDVKPNNTQGGATTTGTWLTRDLNKLEGDTSFISLASNEFTLSSGVYQIEWEAPGYDCGRHQSRLYDVTAGAVKVYGSSGYSDQSDQVNSLTRGYGILDLSDSTTFKIEQQFAQTATFGQGTASNYGGDEIYTQVKITKLDKVFGSGTALSSNGDTASVNSNSIDFAYASSSQYTESTLSDAPIGTFITYEWSSGNVRTQTTAAPTQPIGNMSQDGIQVFARARDETISGSTPATVAIQIGKNLKNVQLTAYGNTGKKDPVFIDVHSNGSNSIIGALNTYDPETGILFIDAGFVFTINFTAVRRFHSLTTNNYYLSAYFNFSSSNSSSRDTIIGISGDSTRLSDTDGDTKIQLEENADDDFIRFDVRGNEAMRLDTLGNLSIGIPPSTSYHSLAVSTNKLGANLRLDQEVDTLGSEISFFNRTNFKWSLASTEDANAFGESFFLYNNDRATWDFLVDGDFGYFGINTTAPAARFHANSAFGAFKVYDFAPGSGPLANTILMGAWEGYANAPQVRYTNTNSANFFDIGLDTNENFVIQPDDNSYFTFRKEGRLNIGYDTTGFRLFLGDKQGGNLFARIHAENAQSGLWVSNDSAGWALFSDNPTTGALMQPGAVGLFMTNGPGLAWTVTKEGKMGIGTPNTPALELSIGPVDDDTGFETNQDGNLSLFTNGTERVRFDQNGNVGIGTTSPAQRLDVFGNAIISGEQFSAFGDSAVLYLGDQQNKIKNLYGTGLQLFSYPGSVPSITIRSGSGDVGIGTSNPDYKLHVSEDFSAGHVMTIENTSTGSNADGLRVVLGTNSPGTSNNYVTFYRAGGTISGQIEGNGSSVDYNTTSDRRLKTNIDDFNGGLEVITKLKPRAYERKTSLGLVEVGFIAQEAQAVFPQMVSGDSTLDVSIRPMMIDYSDLTPILTAGVKELNTIVKEQQATIQGLLKMLKLKEEEIELLKQQSQQNQESLETLKAEVKQIQQSRIK